MGALLFDRQWHCSAVAGAEGTSEGKEAEETLQLDGAQAGGES